MFQVTHESGASIQYSPVEALKRVRGRIREKTVIRRLSKL